MSVRYAASRRPADVCWSARGPYHCPLAGVAVRVRPCLAERVDLDADVIVALGRGRGTATRRPVAACAPACVSEVSWNWGRPRVIVAGRGRTFASDGCPVAVGQWRWRLVFGARLEAVAMTASCEPGWSAPRARRVQLSGRAMRSPPGAIGGVRDHGCTAKESWPPPASHRTWISRPREAPQCRNGRSQS
jgi:hypothetical protein